MTTHTTRSLFGKALDLLTAGAVVPNPEREAHQAEVDRKVRQAVRSVEDVPTRRFSRVTDFIAGLERGVLKSARAPMSSAPSPVLREAVWTAVPVSGGAEWVCLSLPQPDGSEDDYNAFLVLAPEGGLAERHRHPQAEELFLLYGQLLVTCGEAPGSPTETSRLLSSEGLGDGSGETPATTLRLEPNRRHELKALSRTAFVAKLRPPLRLENVEPCA